MRRIIIKKADLNEERGLVPVDVLARESLPRHGQCLQKSLNRSGAISVYLTVCWMFLWPR